MGEQRLLARQGGLISRCEALAAGMSSATISRRVESREWFRILPGVYRHAAIPVGDEVMVRAALLWAAPAGVLSGAWAAWWHGLGRVPTGRISVTVPAASGLRSRGPVVVRRRCLDRADVQRVRGLPVVSRALAVLECAEQDGSQEILDRALQLHLHPRELAATFQRFAWADGAAAARAALGRLDGTVSPPERSLLRALRAAGEVRFRAGVKVVLSGRLAWLDLAVEELKLAVEVDGLAAHTQIETFHRDRWRQNLLVTHGWTVLRYTPRQIRLDLPTVVAQVCQVAADSSHR